MLVSLECDRGFPCRSGSIGTDGHTQWRNNKGVWFLTLEPPKPALGCLPPDIYARERQNGQITQTPVLATHLPKWPPDSLPSL